MGGCNCPGAKEKSRRFYRHRNNFDLFMQGFKSLVVMTLTLFLVFSFMGNCNSAPQVITSKNWGSSMRWVPPSFLLPSPLFLPFFSFFLFKTSSPSSLPAHFPFWLCKSSQQWNLRLHDPLISTCAILIWLQKSLRMPNVGCSIFYPWLNYFSSFHCKNSEGHASTHPLSFNSAV